MRRKFLVPLLAVAAGAAVALLQVRDRPVYAFRVSKFLEREVRDREVKVFGVLVPGSLCRISSDCGYRFMLGDHLPLPAASAPSRAFQTMPVAFDGCVIPDTFRDVPGGDVIVGVQGDRCATCHDFKATQIMARWPDPLDASSRGSNASLPLCD